MLQVGQQILDGKLVIVTLDANNKILAVSVPPDHDIQGDPLVITFNYGQEITDLEALFGIH